MRTEWDLVRQQFRQAVLRRGNRTVEDVAEEMRVSRRTVYNLLQDAVVPSKAVAAAAERFVDGVCRNAQRDSDDA